MDLKIKDVAELLSVSESTVRRWLHEGRIPAYRLRPEGHQWRFSRPEIQRWLIAQGRQNHLDEESNEELSKDADSLPPPLQSFSLLRALNKGMVLVDGDGVDKESFISDVMQKVAEPLDLDAVGVTGLLLDRERLEPTALGNGIALPHTRDFLLNRSYDLLIVAYADPPLPYGALDGKPVHTLFFLFASNDRRHLHLLAKLAHFIALPSTQQLLQERPSKQRLLEAIRQWEGSLLHMQN